jgi:hypothetical protein
MGLVESRRIDLGLAIGADVAQGAPGDALVNPGGSISGLRSARTSRRGRQVTHSSTPRQQVALLM